MYLETEEKNNGTLDLPSGNLSIINTSIYPFSEIFSMSWARMMIPCSNWREPQHLLFQVANGCFVCSSLAPDTRYGIIAMHAILILGFLLYSTWAWNVICAPDIFSWTFGFTFLNMCHVLHGLYRLRPIRLDSELEYVYRKLFQPLGVSRLTFKKLVGPEYAQIFSLRAGEAYALQNLTRTDRLSLLLSGKVQVVSDKTMLHGIISTEFLDSPEFESNRAKKDEKFQVSIVAVWPCRYICWQRSSLEYLLVKETHLATVFSALVARDVTSKVYAMNQKLAEEKGLVLDIRLPSIVFCATKAVLQEKMPVDSWPPQNKKSPVKSGPKKGENGMVSRLGRYGLNNHDQGLFA